MLRRLEIEDFGLIPRAEIEFAAGTTMFTGETGSGKTMVLGALAFVLGERSSPDVVRRGRPRGYAALHFEPGSALRARLESDGFGMDDDEDAVISREMTESGKSSLRVNGRPVNAAYARDLAVEIVDIVGQHEAQRLLLPAQHGHFLDAYGGDETIAARTVTAEQYTERVRLVRELQTLESDERRLAEQYAYAKYALEEIDAAAPEVGEDERLTERRRILDDAEKIALSLRTASSVLGGEDSSAQDALGAACAALDHLAHYGERFAHMASSAAALQSETGQLAADVARELESLEFDAAELETINTRLDLLDRLKRKHGGSIQAVLQAREEFAETVERFSNKDELRAELDRRTRQATQDLTAAAERLSALRHAAAAKLRKSVEAELGELALPGARFGVRFEALSEIGSNGAEDVEFVFAANKGEPERPLSRVASGGELSRVLLALVVVLAGARGTTALVFDEIDAGIGGATANAVAVRLGRLAQNAQVVCVTHLAQIASWAERHYVLEKRQTKTAATIDVRLVDGAQDRTAELARMLSGEAHDAALKHARQLLAQTRERRTALSVSS